MNLPTTKQSRGYDILVWIDEDGDVVSQSYTESGTVFLKSMDSRYLQGDVLQIISHPDEFKTHVPPKLKIGSISPVTNKVAPMLIPPLQ